MPNEQMTPAEQQQLEKLWNAAYQAIDHASKTDEQTNPGVWQTAKYNLNLMKKNIDAGTRPDWNAYAETDMTAMIGREVSATNENVIRNVSALSNAYGEQMLIRCPERAYRRPK